MQERTEPKGRKASLGIFSGIAPGVGFLYGRGEHGQDTQPGLATEGRKRPGWKYRDLRVTKAGSGPGAGKKRWTTTALLAVEFLDVGRGKKNPPAP